MVNFNGQLPGTGLFDADLTAVLANPTGSYVNVHTATFQAGAIRGQLPEPGAAALPLAAAGLVARRCPGS